VTALCAGGGPSQPVPGSQQVQTFLAGALADFLFAEGMGWAADLAAGLGVLSFDLSVFCATDPPPLPNIDAARIAGYFNPLNGMGAAQLNQDFGDLVGHYLWFKTCQCVTGTQPTPPAPQPQPPNYVTNPPGLGTPTDATCGVETDFFATTTFDSSGNVSVTSNPPNYVAPSAKWISVTHNLSSSATPAPWPVTATLSFYGATTATVLGTEVWTETQTVTAAAAPTDTYLVPVGAASIGLQLHTDSAPSSSIGVNVLTHFHCTEPPSPLLQPCCPPDPTLENMIAQVIRLEQQILASLGGITSYTRGTVHTGLSGSGSIPVNGGNPPYEWSLGWLSMLTSDGMIQEVRLTRTTQVWLPPYFNLATTFGYYLNPGVTANVTELVAA
jgi:hypothetical protein